MANALIGSHPSHGYQVVEKIDSNKQLTWGDSGKLFICYPDRAVNTTVLANLPKLSTEMAGWHVKFILATTGNEGHFQILSFGQPVDGNLDASGVDYQKANFMEIAGGAGSYNSGVSGGSLRELMTIRLVHL